MIRPKVAITCAFVLSGRDQLLLTETSTVRVVAEPIMATRCSIPSARSDGCYRRLSSTWPSFARSSISVVGNTDDEPCCQLSGALIRRQALSSIWIGGHDRRGNGRGYMGEMKDGMLLVRVQYLLAPYGITEQRMSGGCGFFLDGKLVACSASRTVLIRVSRADLVQAMRSPNATLAKMRSGATMPGFVRFAATARDVELVIWLDKAVAVVRRLAAGGREKRHRVRR